MADFSAALMNAGRPFPTVNAASTLDTLKVISRVVLPTFGKGVLIRRPLMEAAAQRLGLDTRAVKTLQRLRWKYGPQPLSLAIPFRPHVVLLDPADVDLVLARSPDPFATDTREKRSALDHLEPGNVLISRPHERPPLRAVHEEALATSARHHPFADRFRAVIDEEFGALFKHGPENGELGWDRFSTAWFRIVRRLVLGDSARHDEALTEEVNGLRGRANWAFLLRHDESRVRAFHQHLRLYLDAAEAGSLVSRVPRDPALHPEAQVTQWLFAFDPAGMATFRTLALLAAHPEELARARAEAVSDGLERPFTRTCFLESLRLWPTTPAILRELTEDVGQLRKGTGVIIFTPFLHRDDERLSFAHRLEPSIWNGGNALPAQGLVPFSAGPVVCPAHNLVPLVATLAIGAILSRAAVKLDHPRLDPNALPGTLDHFEIRLGVRHG
jgi:hypothetical protein